MEITSNDPLTPITKVTVTAFVEVEFKFEYPVLVLGKINLDKPLTRKAYLIVKDPEKTKITSIESSSPLVEVRQGGLFSTPGGQPRYEIEVTLQPGLPPGFLRQTITAHSNLTAAPTSILKLSGTVQGTVECYPRYIRFYHIPSQPDRNTRMQKFLVVNKTPEQPLHLMSVEDNHKRMHFDIRPILDGQRYQVTATLNEPITIDEKYAKGSIVVTTDNPKQKTVTVDYFIYQE